MKISAKNPYKRAKRSRFKTLIIITLVVCGGIGFYRSIKVQSKKKSSNSSLSSKSSSLKQSKSGTNGGTLKKPFNEVINLKAYNQCEPIPPSHHKAKDQWSKSVWFAMLFHSFPENSHRELINQLTGLTSGGKSFYVSTRNGSLRHCIGDTETASCSTGDLPKKKNRALFFDKYMMLLRNPRTVFPAATNVKEEKYHDLKGQLTKENWKEIRNTWLDKMMDEWVKKITEWRATDYKDGLYIVYEDLMNAVDGPDVVIKIAKLLKEAGFDVEDEADVPCIWVRAIGIQRIEQFYNFGYDYSDYIPGYTKEQQQMMMRKLKDLMDSIGDSNKELQSILQRYYDDIRDNTIIEDS